MSSHSYNENCSKCDSKNSFEATEQTRPKALYGFCLECGHTIVTKDLQMTLKEVNKMRKDADLKPLKKLKGKPEGCQLNEIHQYVNEIYKDCDEGRIDDEEAICLIKEIVNK